MSGKDAIIEKIISEGKAQAERIIEDAENKADLIIRDAKAEANEYKSREISVANNSEPIIMKRKVTVANLEVRKIILSSKQKVIDEAFTEAKKNISELSEEQYKALIMSMLKSEAKDGDTVIAASKDKKIINTAFINDAAKKLNLKLKLSETYGDFLGGIILSSGIYDKNLTINVELNMLRDEIEPEVAALIFGDNK